MRLAEPRVRPLADGELSPEQEALLAAQEGEGRFGRLNIFRVLVRRPAGLRAFLHWGGYIMGGGTALDPLTRELAILRTGFLCRSGYEWMQHEKIARRLGMAEATIARVKAGADAPGWTPLEAAVIRAADELVCGHHVADATWAALAPLGEEARMDLVLTVGQYTLVAMLLNSFGVQPEPGERIDPDLKA
ncbi:carboxymuconolactone decarboxylase family protein [Thermaurantiacus sp.]